MLTAEGEAFFTAITAGRPGSAPLLLRADGDRWGPATSAARCSRPAAAPGSTRPPTSTACATLTPASAIMNGVPLMVVARNLGHADTRMCERHYGHLAQSSSATRSAPACRASASTPNSNVERLAQPRVVR